jgi:hypothetical protein
MFVSRHLRRLNTVVPINENSRLASDHLPLCADLEINRDQLSLDLGFTEHRIQD